MAKTDADVRDELMEDLDDQVDILLRSVTDFEDKRDASNLRTSRRAISTMTAKLRELRRVAGADPNAQERIEEWPTYLSRLNASFPRLERLKADQRKIDDLEGDCDTREDRLLAAVREYTRAANFDETRKLKALAHELGTAPLERLADAKENARALSRLESEVKRLDPPTGLDKVNESVEGAAEAMLDHYTGTYRKALQRCRNLIRTDRHPQVIRAVTALDSQAADYQRLMQDLENELEDIAEELDDLRLEKSVRPIGVIKDSIRNMTRQLADLKTDARSVDDPKTKEILRYWPENVKSLTRALHYLGEMKKRQYALDGLYKMCADAQNKLQGRIRYYQERPSGISELPDLGIELGRPIERTLAQAADVMEAMASAKDKAEDFSADTRAWNPVEANFVGTLTEIYEYSENVYDFSVRRCEKMALKDKNPMILAAVAALTGSRLKNAYEYREAMDAWIEETYELFRLDCKDMKDLWAALCSIDPEDDSEDWAAAQSERDRHVTNALSKVAGLVGDYNTLRKKYAALEDPKQPADVREVVADLLSRAAERLDMIRRTRTTMTASKSSNNPLTRFVSKYGVEQHKIMEGRNGCTVADIPWESGSGASRADCLAARECMIYEFKPHSPDSIAKGENQLWTYPGYVEQAESYYEKFLPLSEGRYPPSRLGGRKVMEEFEAGGCIDPRDPEVLRLDGKVKTYRRCNAPYVCPK